MGWYARGLYGCNALRLRVWETTEPSRWRGCARRLSFGSSIDRERRLGLSPEGERGTMDAEVAVTEAA